MNAKDQRLSEVIVRAVAARGVTDGTVMLAERLVARWDAPKEERAPAPAKPPIPSVAHHAKQRRAEEREREEVKRETWVACCGRSRVDHRGMLCCEACHKIATSGFLLEPHHLILGSRTDAPEVVMVLCADCHRLDPRSAHRAPRTFVQKVVIPWLTAHGYPVPNRKEYRT